MKKNIVNIFVGFWGIIIYGITTINIVGANVYNGSDVVAGDLSAKTYNDIVWYNILERVIILVYIVVGLYTLYGVYLVFQAKEDMKMRDRGIRFSKYGLITLFSFFLFFTATDYMLVYLFLSGIDPTL